VVALDPAIGAAGGGGMIALSDILGDAGYSIFLANDASSIGNFLDGMELGVTYFNRSQRLNYGVGAFRLTQQYDPDYDVVRQERRVGGSLLAEYPIDKFTRVEASAVLRYAQDHLLRNGEFMDLWLLSNFVSFVRDDARWTWYGPAGGKRLNITAGYTRDLSSGQGDSFTLLFDARKYVTLVPDVVFAARAVTQNSFGDDQEHFYLGGPFSVRGWDTRTIAGTKTAFVQTELRLPLLRGLRLGVPFPLAFPQVSAALLADAAIAGGDTQPTYRIGGVGAGIYVGGGYWPALRVDMVKRTNLKVIFPHTYTRFIIAYNF
jgi:outer membrane protein assembly factor BamA